MSLKIALFVEGSPHDPELGYLWKFLAELAGAPPFDQIVGISKSDLTAMAQPQVQLSGPALPLDTLLAQKYQLRPFDAAIIAWDLRPPWDPTAKACRWTETLFLYQGLAASAALAQVAPEFQQFAHRKLAELQARPKPGRRDHLPCLERSAVLTFCMEPLFELLLALDERALRRSLQLEREPKSWPRDWKKASRVSVDKVLIAPAILAAQKERSTPPFKVRGDFKTNKHGWGRFLVERLWRDEKARKKIEAHPIWKRWLEVTRLCPLAFDPENPAR